MRSGFVRGDAWNAATIVGVAAIAGAHLVVGGVAMAGPIAATQQLALVAPETATELTVEADPPLPVMVARIDLSDQTMNVYLEDQLTYTFLVSTARGGYITPVGRYKAEWLSPRHRSRRYDNAPMPWAVFFHGGYAVHGTTEIRRLGRPASHGCVRLHPDNAKMFFSLVKQVGMENTLITVVR
jgi:lipoprotein-anchoring transpeptidase ErfK/SrfK